MSAPPPAPHHGTVDPPRVSVVVVTWNSADTIAELARPLRDDPGIELVVVDNDSGDDTIAVVRSTAPQAVIIDTGGNCGFAAGVNAGAAVARSDMLVVLNPDCVAAPEVVHHLADRCRRGPGIVAPRLTDEHGAVTRSVRHLPRLRDQFVLAAGLHRLHDRFDPDDDGGATLATAPMSVDVVSGACFATPTALFTELGGLDERFFLYAEEVDYMARVAEAGRVVEFDPTVSVVHIGGVSADQVTTGTDHYLMESRVRWFAKHRGRWAAHAARAALTAWALRRRDRAAVTSMRRPMREILTPTHPRPRTQRREGD
jgi:hypothetical protein